MEENTYPSGAALMASLIDLHRETDNEDVIQVIEAEMEAAVHDPEIDEHIRGDPLVMPESSEWIIQIQNHDLYPRTEARRRYLRLRLCEELDAFDDPRSDRDTNPDNIPETLTDEELRYLARLDVSGICESVQNELTHRGVAEING